MQAHVLAVRAAVVVGVCRLVRRRQEGGSAAIRAAVGATRGCLLEDGAAAHEGRSIPCMHVLRMRVQQSRHVGAWIQLPRLLHTSCALAAMHRQQEANCSSQVLQLSHVLVDTLENLAFP